MSLDRAKAVVDKILNKLLAVRGKGEEATKQALILPVLDALGYDIWDPAEVCPEYEADFATKKLGQKEKVDLAILLEQIPRVYIEIKSVDTVLDGHEGQLARYFNATSTVTLAILTNGLEWRFFTDTGDPNVMDAKPFHISKFDAVDQGLEVFVRFAKPVFSPEAIRDYATDLRYTASIADFLRAHLDLRDREPSEAFVRWILKSENVYDGTVNLNVVERFNPIVKAAMTKVFREIVRRAISAMDTQTAEVSTTESAPGEQVQQGEPPVLVTTNKTAEQLADVTSELEQADGPKSLIVTTERELQSFAILKEQFEHSALAKSLVYEASLRKDVPLSIAYKDTTGYFGVYFNKPSWWIARVVTEAKQPWIGLNVDPVIAATLIPAGFTRMSESPWSKFRVAIKEPEDLNQLHRLIFHAFQKTIADRVAPERATEATAPVAAEPTKPKTE
ncbi:MAG TPA: type I restriction endonuclease [Planctomycetota bacterium]|jgi:hypothetical protein